MYFGCSANCILMHFIDRYLCNFMINQGAFEIASEENFKDLKKVCSRLANKGATKQLTRSFHDTYNLMINPSEVATSPFSGILPKPSPSKACEHLSKAYKGLLACWKFLNEENDLIIAHNGKGDFGHGRVEANKSLQGHYNISELIKLNVGNKKVEFALSSKMFLMMSFISFDTDRLLCLDKVRVYNVLPASVKLEDLEVISEVVLNPKKFSAP